ncbi:hypothetical protein VOLCADRAFT_89965 [Volvox carteri f. nagariensis]|uniref:Acyltransferase n=1 Tax=Volvox carteri f. nagariensis TaxID=3068 RepID=D8TT47_VOLCA|nr:uncharacterized protein VOLCADRAFT_89965 [Volvox carteri f. nagariensis]EFJ49248.1 hypothetical protein VOLCADRAFT_89965 [Volvox carteri f. nagariensis]|eukprot:XP_002949696.1 hypothetical protein VOLCADRAFT_89965 [Volvox carteri f. nagariensis]
MDARSDAGAAKQEQPAGSAAAAAAAVTRASDTFIFPLWIDVYTGAVCSRGDGGEGLAELRQFAGSGGKFTAVVPGNTDGRGFRVGDNGVNCHGPTAAPSTSSVAAIGGKVQAAGNAEALVAAAEAAKMGEWELELAGAAAAAVPAEDVSPLRRGTRSVRTLAACACSSCGDAIIASGTNGSYSLANSSSSSPPPLVVLQPQEPPVPRPPPYVRAYTDGRSPSFKLPLPYQVLAQVTLGLYVGWPYLLLMLAVAALWGSVTAAVVLAVLMLAGSLGSLLWPGHPMYCLAASCVFYVPLWRHIKSWMGAAPAHRDTAMHLLKTRGSVAVLPGGIAEMFAQAEVGGSERERIKMLGRRGFVRLALETGVPIVPVYHFGNSQLLSFGPAALQPLSRKLRVALGTIMGLWGLPVPRPQPLFMCIGRAVRVPYTDPHDERFEQLVDETLEKVVAAFQRLYNEYGSEYGWPDRPLEVW